MKINLKLFVSLKPYLPAGAKGNEIEIEVGESDSPNQILQRLNVPMKLTHLWLLNGNYIEPEHRDDAILSDGDTLAVWPPVAGG
jgi:sulfur-carrier protein